MNKGGLSGKASINSEGILHREDTTINYLKLGYMTKVKRLPWVSGPEEEKIERGKKKKERKEGVV